MSNSNQWINSKDRLPEEDGRYLCVCGMLDFYFRDVLYFRKKFTNGNDKKFENVFTDYESGYGDYVVTEVIYWMPIPEIPEEIN